MEEKALLKLLAHLKVKEITDKDSLVAGNLLRKGDEVGMVLGRGQDVFRGPARFYGKDQERICVLVAESQGNSHRFVEHRWLLDQCKLVIRSLDRPRDDQAQEEVLEKAGEDVEEDIDPLELSE